MAWHQKKFLILGNFLIHDSTFKQYIKSWKKEQNDMTILKKKTCFMCYSDDLLKFWNWMNMRMSTV